MGMDCEGPTGSLYASGSLARATHKAFGVEVIKGPNAPTRRVIEVLEFRIGKASANHLTLADPAVSRFHCVIEYTPRGLLLRDLGSTNGTQVGNCWVERAYLNPLVPIQVGNTTLQVVSIESSRALPAPEPQREVPILGSSPAIERLLGAIPVVAKSGVTVLLEGETGTGKSLLAESLHRSGPRQAKPFVVVDCGAIAPSLIESELFGHERGAFTGASERRIGRIEQADRGTLLLDEISEMPPPLQAKLLRVLQEREVDRVGGGRSIPVDVRVIATSNRDLEAMVAAKLFRADLFYRLSVFPIALPALRERRDDIPALAAHLVTEIAERLGRPPLKLGPSALACLQAHDYPGNVRELGNILERALVRCRATELSAEHLDRSLRGGDGATSVAQRVLAPATPVTSLPPELPIDLGQLERLAISEALRRVNGNRTHAARLLGISLRTLRNKLRAQREEAAAGGQVLPIVEVEADDPAWPGVVARRSQEETAV
jgi:DNA-binding NtrC family response regulator